MWQLKQSCVRAVRKQDNLFLARNTCNRSTCICTCSLNRRQWFPARPTGLFVFPSATKEQSVSAVHTSVLPSSLSSSEVIPSKELTLCRGQSSTQTRLLMFQQGFHSTFESCSSGAHQDLGSILSCQSRSRNKMAIRYEDVFGKIWHKVR